MPSPAAAGTGVMHDPVAGPAVRGRAGTSSAPRPPQDLSQNLSQVLPVDLSVDLAADLAADLPTGPAPWAPTATHPRPAVERALCMARAAFGAFWSVSLLVAGAWLLLNATARWPMFGVGISIGGVAALLGALLVWLVCVADPIVPNADRRLVWLVECAVSVMFLVCVSGAAAGALALGVF